MKYASGKVAWAICDRCGLRGKHAEMEIEPGTGLFVHPNHLFRDGRLRPRRIDPDGVAIRNPRPNNPIPTNTTLTADNTYITADSTMITADMVSAPDTPLVPL